MNQPSWEYVGNLGDVNIADYGGFIVYRDTTGAYRPEVELYDANEDETGGIMYRFILEPIRWEARGSWHNEWFVDKLREVAACSGMSYFGLLRGLLSNDPIKLASAYQAIVGYFGAHEFDSYPVTLTEDEAQLRYASIPTR